MSARNNGSTNRFGVPAGKFLELSQKTNRPQPYEVTDKLSVTPPTRGRRMQMADAERRMVVAQAQLNIAYSLSRTPSPPMPQPVQLKPDADDDTRAAAAAEYKRDIAEWKQEVLQWRANLENAQQTIAEQTGQQTAAETDYDRALFGDVYDDMVAFFDQQPEALWDEFVLDYRKHLLPSQPDDGKCPACGRVEDEDAAGKAIKSSTG